MKLWPWGLLLIGLIGIAAAAVVVTVTQSGSISVVQAGLIWTPTGAPNLANIQLPVGGSISVPFTAQNSGGLPLTITCSSNIPTTTGITVSCTGLPASTLAAGATLSADIVFTATTTASAANLAFIFTLSGSA